MAKKKTILIVDDHAFIREGLKAMIGRILSDDIRYEVVGEAENGREALEMAKVLEPDIWMMDIALPDQSGLEVTREIKAAFPETLILILSMLGEYTVRLLNQTSAADAYHVKETIEHRD